MVVEMKNVNEKFRDDIMNLHELGTTLLLPIFARHVGILPLNLLYPFVILPLVQISPPTIPTPHYICPAKLDSTPKRCEVVYLTSRSSN